jgi:predicted phosphodiesterase
VGLLFCYVVGNLRMGIPVLTDEELLRRVEVYQRCKSQRKAAEHLGISKGTLWDSLKTAARRGLMGTKPVLPGFAIKSTSTQVGPDGDTQREWIKQAPEAGEVFELPPGHAVKAVSALVGSDGRTIQQWIKTKEETQVDLIAAIKAEFDCYKGAAKPIKPPKETFKQLMQVYPICDPHIGMLSWGPETGQSNDLKIGVDRMDNGMHRLISLAPEAETAVIIQTGDFLHADSQANTTPASGHQLDVDGRAQKVKLAGVRLLRRSIDLALDKHKTVIVKNLKGNHDPESAAWLNIALGLFYSNEPRVQIDLGDGNNDIWLHLFGKNYIGATHGHTMKPERMAMVMADDRPDYWGASEYRWMIYGHIHHETVKEVGSVRCESFRQPVPKDAYAHSHGYRAGNSMSSVTLHRDDGEIGRHKVNFPRGRT